MAKEKKQKAKKPTTEEVVAALCEDVKEMSASPQNLRIAQLGEEE